MALTAAIAQLSPNGYEAHSLHGPGSAWVEKNCYIDVWIEVVHALRLEPAAMLAFTLAVDFELDQWTFFKPPHEELSLLYGIEVFELNVWRGDILTHALQQAGKGRLVFTEADSYWLPDTQGTDYRRQHTKTTIVVNALDVENRQLGYFHNSGYHQLEGEDFSQLFRLQHVPDPTFMPLYAEFARLDRVRARPARELVQLSLECLRRHLGRAPALNPIRRFAEHFDGDVAWLMGNGLALYHAYAFATLRQLGAAFELAAAYLKWLAGQGEQGLGPALSAFGEISSGAKMLVLKTARAVNSGKKPEFAPMLADMAAAWDAGMHCLRSVYG